ncbi:restriction endonuclease subunit S [Moorena sp. SIO4G3]|uniref:restriction endonuclease subunit S n=1 Tax=Moorena sp. SIO4G3 TaxID=2607821 RepID=UPI0025FB0029|nr:restriction endonuclease subunit S [Moorena sp. SIO4G3]
MKIDLPSSWTWAKCSEVIDVRDGTHDTPKYVSSGYPLITSKNLKPEGIDFSELSYISEKDHYEISKRSKVDKGDILLAMIGTIGNPVIVNTEQEFSIKNVALFKLAKSYIDTKYFKYLLKTPIVIRQLNCETRGGTQKFVSLKVLRNMIIPFPPLEEQKRIAAILDKADSIRRKRKDAIALTEELLRSTFLDMFGDPVTNPKGWEIVKLGSQIEELKYGTNSKCSNIQRKEDIPVLRIPNIVGDQLCWDELKYTKLESK